MAKYTPMIEQYLQIKAQVPDAFLFFRLGDFYEMFFDDATKAVEELEITLTARESGKGKVPMCGVPFHSAQSYIERLIERGYKVAICEQVEDPSVAKGIVRREIVQIITPGTVMDEQMLTPGENNFLVSIGKVEGRYGLAAVDLSTGEVHLTELSDSPMRVLDELRSYQPKEVVCDPAYVAEHELVAALQKQKGLLLTPCSLASLDQAQLTESLHKQFPQYSEVCTTHSLQHALAVLYAYLTQTQKRFLAHLSRLHHYQADQHMVLDESAKRNLELFQTMETGKKHGSLLWLLDQTATAMGGRLLKRWMDKPLLNTKSIEQRQQVVEAFLADLLFLDELKVELKQVYDLERLAARIAYGSANARDLYALKSSLEMIPAIKQRLLAHESPVVNQLAHTLDACEDLCVRIDQAIVDDPPVSIKEGGLIREKYDEQLDQYKVVQTKGKDWLAELLQKERAETGIKSLKIGYNRVFGYYIEVTKSNLRHLPENRYIRKQTLANAERFITPELKEQEQLITEAAERSVEREFQLFTELREQVAAEVLRLQQLAEQVARIDALFAFAVVANKYQYTKPTVSGGQALVITEGRHPVVEAVLREGVYTANDVHLAEQDRQILLITGPNMAGKSTYMRQVALITILAQLGSFVPATEAHIPVVDRIFTRIGAADDLVGGRSTFMVEMTETCYALQEATRQSLILLDEVGRGTSTYDGMALAQAIIEYIHQSVGAKTLFSTHYHELIQLAEELPGLVNIHAECVEKDGKVEFLHRMLPGGADQSYGIHVAELAGLPAQVVQRAKQLLQSLEQSTETESPSAATTGAVETAAAGQLELFQWEPAESKPSLSSEQTEVLQLIEQWDMMNQTPFETMQLLQKCKQMLQQAKSTVK